MKSNFGENIHIRNNSVSNKTKERFVSYIGTSIEKDYKTSLEHSMTEEECLGESGPEKIKTLYSLIKQKFKEKGVDAVSLAKIVFSRTLAREKGRLGEYRGYVEMFDLDMENMELKQLLILKTLAHELYHGTAVASFDLNIRKDEKGKKNITYQNKNIGAGYPAGEGSAIEEGAALEFEQEMFEQIKKMFSKGTLDTYSVLMDSFAKTEEGSYVNILSYDEETGNADASYNDGYKDSQDLIRYLKSKIADFDHLLEDARIYRKTLGLARAIEHVFGEGAYRRITTCTPDNAFVLELDFKKQEKSKDVP